MNPRKALRKTGGSECYALLRIHFEWKPRACPVTSLTSNENWRTYWRGISRAAPSPSRSHGRQVLGDSAGKKFALFSAIVECDPVITIAAQKKAGERGGPLLNGANALQMSAQVLGDGPLPADNVMKDRRFLNSHRHM